MMKNIRTLLLSSVALLGSACFTSCQLEPMELPAEELYVRAFIKKFGLIDPNQTWSSAKETQVTIVPDAHIDNARIYGIRDGRNYIVANITDIDNKVTIPIDVPSDVTDLKVDLDGDIFYTKVGGTVDPRNPASRSFLGNKTIGTPEGNITVTDGTRKDFLIDDIWQLFAKLPENGPIQGVEKYPGNLDADGIITDFMLYGRGKTITVYPVHYDTRQTHTLGIYYVMNKDKENEEVVRVPIYTMRKPPEYENLRLSHYSELPMDTKSLLNLPGQQSPSTNLFVYRNKPNGVDYEWHNAEKITYDNRSCYKISSTDRAEYGWDSQLYIMLPENTYADPNVKYHITMHVRADHETSIYTNTMSAIGQNFGPWYNNVVHFPADSWETIDFEGYLTKTDDTGENITNPAKMLAFNLNGDDDYPYANNFYIADDIKWYPEIYNTRGADRSFRPAAGEQGTPNKWTYTHTWDNGNTVTATAEADMADAHILLRNGESGPLLCPLAATNYQNRTEAYSYKNNVDVNAVTHVASKGINVTVPEGMRYGFYLEFKDNTWPYNDKIIYSEVDGNIKYQNRTFFASNTAAQLDKDNLEHRRYATLCAMSYYNKPGTNTKYTYLTFEDWIAHSSYDINSAPADALYPGDYDLNDVSFLVEGITDDDIDDEPTAFNFLICAEDLGVTDDFDFNDMIVGVSIVTEGPSSNMKKYVTFRALAAGGTLPLYLHCASATAGDLVSGTDVVRPAGVNDAEWHNWFGVSDYTQMLNTQTSRSYLPGKAATVEVPSSFTLEGFGRPSNSGNKGINGIYITVREQNPANGDSYDPTKHDDQNGVFINPPVAGEAPQMFLINDVGYDDGTNTRNWRWPSERKHIYEVFEHFSDWVGNASTHADWYKEQPKTGVYTNRPR